MPRRERIRSLAAAAALILTTLAAFGDAVAKGIHAGLVVGLTSLAAALCGAGVRPALPRYPRTDDRTASGWLRLSAMISGLLVAAHREARSPDRFASRRVRGRRDIVRGRSLVALSSAAKARQQSAESRLARRRRPAQWTPSSSRPRRSRPWFWAL